jgi:hypothetical protein
MSVTIKTQLKNICDLISQMRKNLQNPLELQKMNRKNNNGQQPAIAFR